MLFSLPTVIILILSDNSSYRTALQISAVWVGLGCFAGYFAVSRLYIMAEYLYVSDFHYHKESDITTASQYMVKKNMGKILGVYISYVGWLILCFFVIPIVFVYPYFKQTALLSQSYIYDIESNNPNSPYHHSDKPVMQKQPEI